MATKLFRPITDHGNELMIVGGYAGRATQLDSIEIATIV